MIAEIKKNLEILILRLIFLILPTILVMFVFINYINKFFPTLNFHSSYQIIVFASSLIISFILYSNRVRFLISSLIPAIIIIVGFIALDKFDSGEFDIFFLNAKFILISIILVLGWIIGFGLARFKFFSIIIAVVTLALSVILFNDRLDSETSFVSLLLEFSPILIYSFYIIYINEILYKLTVMEKKVYFILFNRIFLFFFIVLFLYLVPLFLVHLFFSLDKRINNYLQNQEYMNNMMSKTASAHFDIKDYVELLPKLDRSEELLFISYIENFFDEGTPNPLYLRRYILNNYNPNQERFEIDSSDNESDLFAPNPSNIPVYFAESDTSVITKSRGDLKRINVRTDIYLTSLSDNSFISPSIGYYCKRLPILEIDTSSNIYFAYQCSSYVSLLNSAYFVYNTNDPTLNMIKSKRDEVLRQVNFKDIDSNFLRKYTRIPQGHLYDTIAILTRNITKDANTMIDKINRVRDFFSNENIPAGEPKFKYSLNPGEPPKDNKSRLYHFLFKNRQGYCTYFATSTLFMLRSIGIPTRLVAGFLPVDRSAKNKGWYWVYADQAHAWVEIYFPGYGWLDFDTTIPAEEIKEAEKPDGTPPMFIENPFFVGNGIITNLDKSNVKFKLKQVLLNQKPYLLDKSQKVEINLLIDTTVQIVNDKGDKVQLNTFENGDIVIASIDANEFSRQNISAPSFRFENIEDLDEMSFKPEKLFLKHLSKEMKETEEDTSFQTEKIKNYFIILLIILLIFFVLIPFFTYLYYKSTAKPSNINKNKLYNFLRYSAYLFNQLNITLDGDTLQEFAINRVDNRFNLNYIQFILHYNKIKYSNSEINEQDKEFFKNYINNFSKQLFKQLKFKEKLMVFFNTYRTFKFYFSFRNK